MISFYLDNKPDMFNFFKWFDSHTITRHQLHNGTCTESRLDDYKNQASRREEFYTVEKTYWWILNVDLISAYLKFIQSWMRGVRDWYRPSVSKFLCGIYLLCRRHWHIGDIYQVYTKYIPVYILGIYQTYIRYITGMEHILMLGRH